ncbi:MAG: DNA polymerase III subunit gamma/tau [Fimbriiglobus sp.]|nr:DNA polymerase III subunit gamma/tau [Fimbriiglobus sp.]
MAKTKGTKPSEPTTAAPAPAKADTPAYTVVARRYRPQQFADLIGQEHVAQALTNAITSGRIAHAYLFTGARGTGKTSTARILAKALNCEKGPTPTPCDVCPMCVSIAAGNDVDAIEIDGASNNKVDEARELRSNVGYMPTRGRFKVYIIDEVHMLSTGAFNALLKTMEEPPPHVKFILATTDPHKIPITILSRCQRYDFAPVSGRRIFDALTHIVSREGIDAEPEALRMVARRANGSMRDSQTLLEQLLASAEGKLTAEQVHRVFGTLSEDAVLELADAILKGDAKTAVELVGATAEKGLQLGELLDQLTDYWRAMMLTAVGGGDSADLTDTAAEQVKRHAATTTLDAILAGIEILTETRVKLRGSPHAPVLLEVAAVRLAKLADLLSVAELAQWFTQGGGGGGHAPAQRVPAHLPAGNGEAVKKKVVTAPEVRANGAVGASAARGEAKPTGEESIEVVWDKVLEQVGPILATHLRQAAVTQANFGPNSLVLPFPAAYSAAYETAKAERNQETLRKAFKHVTGREWTVRVELDAAPPTANGAHPPPTVPPRPATRSRSELLALPFFAALGDTLGAQLMRADDGFDPFGQTVVEPVADTPETPTPTDPDEI